MPATHNYSLAQVAIAINGVPIQGGAGDGDKITIATTSDDWSETIGADGEFTRNQLLDDSVDITLMLMYGSAYNSILQGLADIDRATGLGAFALSVVDLNLGFTFFAARCYIKRRPDRAFGQEAGASEWQIKATNARITNATSRPI